ncbi:hypothetical protein DRJ22_02950 [Candidatus Woesearchaeota archaeon]|nr:MAG: hypothetical protein B6U93_01315 [Candidatus Woesearchaeota archaeon ex4484_78]RLE46038.1 MAG: hypothetical protein DRJ22_02950 [Candidatus Woesearchaeota archaeon]
MPDDNLRHAKQELNRADHSIAVSLKYTRTVDVIKSIIKRLINTLTYILDALLEKAKEEEKIKEIPKIPGLKASQVKNLYKDDQTIQDFCNFYMLLRKIDKAKYESQQEYRRHVTMIAHLEETSIEITIDIITDYYNKTKEFLTYVENQINETNE